MACSMCASDSGSPPSWNAAPSSTTLASRWLPKTSLGDLLGVDEDHAVRADAVGDGLLEDGDGRARATSRLQHGRGGRAVAVDHRDGAAGIDLRRGGSAPAACRMSPDR